VATKKPTKAETYAAIDKAAEKFVKGLPDHPTVAGAKNVAAAPVGGIDLPPEALDLIRKGVKAAGVPDWVVSWFLPVIIRLLQDWQPGQIVDWLKKRFGR
jgi:hypothetical protein